MSNFIRMTRRPGTDRFEAAVWLDDYYGPRVYGVRFPDGTTYCEVGRRWEFADEAAALSRNDPK